MTEIESRISANYPVLQMTLISLIVALVYEKLIDSAQAQEQLWTATPDNLLLWSQLCAIAIWPLEYWFTTSLSSISVRIFFRPRDAVGPVAPALAFFMLASSIGDWNPAIWLSVAGFLFAIAWFVLREQGRSYAGDPMLNGNIHTHHRSRWIMLSAGVAMVGAGLGLHFDSIGPAAAGSVLSLATVISVVAHVVWYREWRGGVMPPEEVRTAGAIS